MRGSTGYLVACNGLLAAVWAVALAQALTAAAQKRALSAAMPAALPTVVLAQSLALLEPLHALLGVVRSNPATSLLQWSGRALVLFPTLLAHPEVRLSAPAHRHTASLTRPSGALPSQLQARPEAGVLALAWSSIEILRYPQYALSLLGACPFALSWLRYSGFIPLYPVGFLMEALLLRLVTNLGRERGGLFTLRMPNRLNFSFDFTFVAGLYPLMYPPVFYILFSHMLTQRQKKLAQAKRSCA